jgi:phosphopantetheinyl transferase
MPIFYTQDIDQTTKLGIWKIEEEEDFFLSGVPLQRNITHPHKRLQHLAGRYLLKYLFPDFPVSLIKVADTLKPFLENEAYHFSISHCGDYAAVIVSKNLRVGVDIEIPNEKVARIKHKFLHEDELFIIENLKSLQRQVTPLQTLTILWSSKEAIFKWWSFGKVDFSENIRLNPVSISQEGIISAAYVSDEMTALQVRYKVFDELCLAFVCYPS